MGATAAPLLVPSQLPEGAEAWARDFATRIVDEVARPLFSATSAKDLERRLPGLLTRGAILRFRWLNALSEMPSEQAAELVNAWIRPPPPSVLQELQDRAAVLLGEERSFKVQRSLALMFVDCPKGADQLFERWSVPDQGARSIADLARLLETTARHDVLALAWLAVLLGDVEAPRPAVADSGASLLLRLAAQRASALRSLLDDRTPPRKLVLDDRCPRAWRESHRALVLPAIMLIGLAFLDPDVRHIALIATSDPEDEGLSMLEVRVSARRAADAVRERLERRALRSGVVGSLADERGGAIVVTAGTRVL
jgi:hypothetical protein